jgi:hypothetical protein
VLLSQGFMAFAYWQAACGQAFTDAGCGGVALVESDVEK